MVNAVDKRSQNLKATDPTFRTPEQIVIDGGMDATQRWNKQYGGSDPQVLDDYMSGVNQGKSPSEAYQLAIRNKITKLYPQTFNTNANTIVDAKEGAKYLVKPAIEKTNTKYIYDEKSKSVVPNPDYKENRNASSSS